MNKYLHFLYIFLKPFLKTIILGMYKYFNNWETIGTCLNFQLGASKLYQVLTYQLNKYSKIGEVHFKNRSLSPQDSVNKKIILHPKSLKIWPLKIFKNSKNLISNYWKKGWAFLENHPACTEICKNLQMGRKLWPKCKFYSNPFPQAAYKWSEIVYPSRKIKIIKQTQPMFRFY